MFVILGGKKKPTHAHVPSAHVHPHGNAPTSLSLKTTRHRSPHKDKKKQDVVGTKQFWEEHNKVRRKNSRHSQIILSLLFKKLLVLSKKFNQFRLY